MGTYNLSADEIIDSYVLKQSEEYTLETGDLSTVYYIDNEATFVNNEIWYIIKAGYDIDQSELKKIQESLL